MGIKRVVDVEFWNDDKVVDMFSPEDKLFMLYLLTNPHTTQLGIYPINKKNMAFELGYSPEAVTVLIDRFQNNYQIIRYSENTREIAIKNYLRHSIIKGGKPVEDLLLKEIAAVKNKELVQWAFKNINGYDNLNDTVKKIVSLFSNDNDIHNDNDNENEVSSSVRLTNRPRIVDNTQMTELEAIDSYEALKNEIMENKDQGDKVCEWCGCKTTVLHRHHYPVPKRMGGTETVQICSNCHHEFHIAEGQKYGDRHSDVTAKPQKPTRHKYGQYQNVLLSDTDMEKLKSEFPEDWEQRIERLSEYIASKEPKYKNHLAVIRTWARKEQPAKKKPKYENAGTFV